MIANALLQRLTSPLPIDAYRTLANPLWTRSVRGVVESAVALTPHSTAVRIRTNRAWPGHRAGQYVTLGVEIDGVRHHRCYSITTPNSGPGSTTIEIAVQRVEGGLMSSYLNGALRPGDVVHLGEPDGDFTLPSLVPERLLFVTGGSGITPVIGMLRALALRAPVDAARQSDVIVVHHAPTPERTMFADDLSQLADRHEWLTVHVVHTRADGARLDANRLDTLCPDWRDREAYVCGPSALTAFATDHWAEHGALDRLHLERFTLALPGHPATDAPDSTVTTTFERSGVAVEATAAATLLDTAEAAGVMAPYGCRTGNCHTCSTRLVSGCTTDLRDGRVSDAGTHVQLCVSAPLTDVVLDV
ncbi:MAG TPA: FAD-binding oxidoreductase [Microthrixaceae bacterium]|nr:2Fe-2S iron-sulfur cluster binding domain-containing protein [Microthrixaceae bacterium]HNI33922.1 FAD-binding oxidoreductase [Microthrixaceae bacterium]